MIVTVNGVTISLGTKLEITVRVDQSGETLPPVIVTATGGRLDVYRSHVKVEGNVSFHYFGEE